MSTAGVPSWSPHEPSKWKPQEGFFRSFPLMCRLWCFCIEESRSYRHYPLSSAINMDSAQKHLQSLGVDASCLKLTFLRNSEFLAGRDFCILNKKPFWEGHLETPSVASLIEGTLQNNLSIFVCLHISIRFVIVHLILRLFGKTFFHSKSLSILIWATSYYITGCNCVSGNIEMNRSNKC